MASPGQVGRNADIAGIGSYVIVEPPPYLCGDYGFHPELTDDLKFYGVEEADFASLVEEIKDCLKRARTKFWVWSFVWLACIVVGLAVGMTRSTEFALAIAAPLIMYAYKYRCLNTISPARRTDLASVYRYSSAIIFVGIAIGAWCRTATFNDLPSICAKFGTGAYSWQVRSPKIVCGQLSLKRCVIQVVPRPGALLERAKNEESQLEQGEVISINDEDACIICFAHKINTSLAPCGHKVVCSECASKVSTCPMCRGKIKKLESFNPAASSATETTTTTTSDSESTAVELSDMVDEEL